MDKWIIIMLASLLFVSVLGISAFAATETLNVTSCSGATSCSVANYNVNSTSIGHTISGSGAGETGTTDSWKDSASVTGDIINTVKLRLRHGGQASIDGDITITFQDEAGSTQYCTNATPNAVADTYVEITPLGCSWTAARLDDLEITFHNGDGGSGQDAYIYFAEVYVDYSPNLPPLWSANLADTPDPINATNTITYTGTATDPNSEQYRMTVCKTDSIVAGYPGTCSGTTLCTSVAANSGAQASCNYATSTSDVGTLTAYGFICDSAGNCNSTSTSTTTTVLSRSPLFTVSLADQPDPLFYGSTLTYNATGSDPESNNYAMTVCRTNSITAGFPGTCAASQDLCSGTSTTSGTRTNCSYVTQASDVGTLTAYAFLCDSNSICNTTSTSTTTTVNQYGWLNVSNIVTTSPTYVNQNATFTINATVWCAGGTNALCGTVQGAARYGTSTPDTNVNGTAFQLPFYNVTGLVTQTSPSTLSNGESWNFSMVVNFTGEIGSSYLMDVLFNSTTYASNIVGNDTADRTIQNVSSSCVPTAGQNWNINASGNCVISGAVNVLNITILGSGSITFRDATITSTGCAIIPTAGQSIVVAIEPTTTWENAC